MKKVKDTQLAFLVFACAAVRLVTAQQVFGAYSAQLTLVALLIKYAALFALLFVTKKAKINVMSTQSAWLAAIIFASSCAATALDTESFYRYACDEPLDARMVILLVLAAAACALFCGDGTVARTAQIAAFLLVIAAAVLAFSNIKNADMSKLSMQQLTLQNTAQPLSLLSYIPAEALLLVAFCSDNQRFKKCAFVLLGTFLFFAVLLVSTELVFGSGTQSELRPLQMLTRVGSISVFKRLDAVYVFVWIFALLAKTSCMLSAARSAFQAYFIEKHSSLYALLLTLLFTALLSYMSVARQRDITTACIFLCIIIALVKKRGQNNAC